MSTVRKLLAAVSLAVLASAAPASGVTPTLIYGVVMDPSGGPSNGAIVSIDFGQRRLSVRTDEQGRFHLIYPLNARAMTIRVADTSPAGGSAAGTFVKPPEGVASYFSVRLAPAIDACGEISARYIAPGGVVLRAPDFLPERETRLRTSC